MESKLFPHAMRDSYLIIFGWTEFLEVYDGKLVFEDTSMVTRLPFEFIFFLLETMSLFYYSLFNK